MGARCPARSSAVPIRSWRTSPALSESPSALARASTSAATPATCGVAAEVHVVVRADSAELLGRLSDRIAKLTGPATIDGDPVEQVEQAVAVAE